jgi:serine/threonine protein kinase
VKLGWDNVDKRQVAIKISRLELSTVSRARSGAIVLDNVKREAELMRYLNEHTVTTQQAKVLRNGDRETAPVEDGSKYLCLLIEEFEDERFHYMVTEFLPGGDVCSILASIPVHRITEDQGRLWFKQIVNGVRFLHARHVAHLDISLENICLDANEDCKIIDFGVAAIHPRAATSSNHTSVTSSSLAPISFIHLKDGTSATNFLCKPIVHLPGKIGYMSTELYGNQVWDAYKNDIFALGVILFCLLVGHPPFRRADPSDAWFHILWSGKWLTPRIKKLPSADVYSHLSENALNLLNSIFKSQEVRPTLDQILAHPWMQG